MYDNILKKKLHYTFSGTVCDVFKSGTHHGGLGLSFRLTTLDWSYRQSARGGSVLEIRAHVPELASAVPAGLICVLCALYNATRADRRVRMSRYHKLCAANHVFLHQVLPRNL